MVPSHSVAMKCLNHIFLLTLVGLLVNCASPTMKTVADKSTESDLWLEEINGDRAISWVKEQNARSLPRLESDSRFGPLQKKLLKVINSPDRLSNFYIRKNEVYDFWQDSIHVRGLVRRTTWKGYRSGHPQWETVLDIDELASRENENWVYDRFSVFRDRAIVSLSRDGKDAKVFREFDLKTKKFLPNGFSLSEGKHEVDWLDENTWLVGLASENEITESGYPRRIRLWKRGTQVLAGPILATAEATDVSMHLDVIRDEYDLPARHVLIRRDLDFFNFEYFLWRNGKTEKVPLPTDAEIVVHGDNALITLRKDWVAFDRTYRAGSLLFVGLEELMKRAGPPEIIFSPNENQVLLNFTCVRDRIFVGTMKDVSVRWAEPVRGADGHWQEQPLDLPTEADVGVRTESETQGVLVFEGQSFLMPATRLVYDLNKNRMQFLERAKPRFDSSPLEVKQYFAVSRDGTRIPYYQVSKKGLELNSENPTLLNAYGGFEISETPFYSYGLGLSWLSDGGVFVLANIRGGGEYGPRWHQAAMKENRQRAFDDFFAVAEDLVSRKVTTPRKLGAFGGSNGGLLMGVAMTQRPDLFGAIAIQVPLLDMLRFHKLLAGASWIGEYGNPDLKEDRDYLLKYSPYQSVRQDRTYPEVFFMTSKADDRVHPGHARRTAALMSQMNHPFLYYENIEGGHGGAANLNQRAYWLALQYTYFKQKLMD